MRSAPLTTPAPTHPPNPLTGPEAAAEARRLDSVAQALAAPGSPPGLQEPRWRTCAVVGNGGGLARAQLGRFIDAHDAVVRFNGMPVGGAVAATTGNRTTARPALRAFLPLGQRTRSAALSVRAEASSGKRETTLCAARRGAAARCCACSEWHGPSCRAAMWRLAGPSLTGGRCPHFVFAPQVRVLNHSRSRHVCCRGEVPEGKDAGLHPPWLLIWRAAHPQQQRAPPLFQPCAASRGGHCLSVAFLCAQLRAVGALRRLSRTVGGAPYVPAGSAGCPVCSLTAGRGVLGAGWTPQAPGRAEGDARALPEALPALHCGAPPQGSSPRCPSAALRTSPSRQAPSSPRTASPPNLLKCFRAFTHTTRRRVRPPRPVRPRRWPSTRTSRTQRLRPCGRCGGTCSSWGRAPWAAGSS